MLPSGEITEPWPVHCRWFDPVFEDAHSGPMWFTTIVVDLHHLLPVSRRTCVKRQTGDRQQPAWLHHLQTRTPRIMGADRRLGCWATRQVPPSRWHR